MNNRDQQSRHYPSPRVFLMAGIMLALILCLFSSSALAHGSVSQARGPQITAVTAGFNGKFRSGSWIPVQISLANNEASFDGRVSITPPPSTNISTGKPTSPTTYQETISLPPLSKKQVTMYIPTPQQLSNNSLQLTIALIDNSGVLVAKNQALLTSLASNELSIGLLTSGSNPSTQSISRAVKDIASATPQMDVLTSADLFPTRAGALDNFDLLIINNFATSNLSADQLTALQAWVRQGGTLVVTGGPEWQRTLKPLPSELLPVAISGNSTLPPGTHLLPAGIPLTAGDNGQPGSDTLSSSIPISVGTAQPGSRVMLAANAIPLVAQVGVGQGQVYYLAYDPLLTPLANWDQIEHLWNTLIMRATGDQLLNTSTGVNAPVQTPNDPFAYLSTSLQMLIPNIIPSPWLILGLLLGYVLFLGPVRLILVRWLKRRDWSWSIALCIVVIFSLLSYGLVLQQKGTAITNSSISFIQLSRPGANGSSEHITNYIGIFVPSQGDFHVRIPGPNLVQPPDSSIFSNGMYYSPSTPDTSTTIVTNSDATEATLQGAQIWSLHTLVSTHDAHTSGGLSSHLILGQSNVNGSLTPVLTGTITNTLPFKVKDAYLLIGDDFLSLGTLEAGETRPVRFSLINSVSQTSGSTSLLDSLAADLHISTGQLLFQSGYRNLDQNNERQRHQAILAATLINASPCIYSGVCYRPAFATANGVIAPPGLGSNVSQKSLQLTNAPVTLIGWGSEQADPTQQVTVNGSTPAGTHETLLQAPLDMSYAGAVSIPASLINSQIVDFQVAQNSMMQSNYIPGIYCMDTGQVTFELTMPSMPALQQSSLNITEASKNALMTRGPSCAQQTINDVSRLRVTLYNWQTGNWDSQQFLSNSSSTYQLSIGDAQPYVGPGGRVLLQFANQDQTLGASIFAMPEMEMSGTITG